MRQALLMSLDPFKFKINKGVGEDILKKRAKESALKQWLKKKKRGIRGNY